MTLAVLLKEWYYGKVYDVDCVDDGVVLRQSV